MGPPTTLTVGQLLRRYRSLARLTQEQLAERSGYSADYIGKLERGQRLPPSTAIDRLALVLGLDAATQVTMQSARTRATLDGPGGSGAQGPLTGSLPVQVTSFVGRDEELKAAAALLETPGLRLLTLTGPGGIGKTRLVVRLCELLGDRFEDGWWFVPLATVTDPQHVLGAVASVLGVTETPGGTLTDAIVRFLGHGQRLLVLDNFEHVQSAAPFVAQVVERCPQLRVVVTSRAVLSLASEYRLEVPPLASPATGIVDIAAIDRHAAVRLFIERARTVRPDFRLEAATAGDVAAICRAVDGVPLAIELAAARTRLFPPKALRQRLSPRLALLSGGPVDRSPRHQTLRATIDWSYDLLSPPERLLFARLGVFAGSTIEAVEEICDTDGSLDTVALMTSLVDKSLLHQVVGELEPRMWMLETIREYASERLTEVGEDALLRARHASYYAEIVARIEPRLTGEDQDQALRQLDLEIDNLRAALAWLLERGRIEEQLRMAEVLARYQLARGSCTEAGEWLDRGLTADTGVSDAVRGRALLALGEVTIKQGDLDRAGAALEEARSQCDSHGDQASVGRALTRLGVIACRQGKYELATAYDEAGLRLATAVGDRRERAYALVNLGTVATHLGEHATACERLGEAVELHRAIGDRDSMGHALINLGYDLAVQGHLDEATALFEEVVATGQAFGFTRQVAYALENLGNISVLRGDLPNAAAQLRHGLLIGRELSDQHLLMYLFSDLIKLNAAQGHAEHAARLGGVVTGLRNRLGLSMAPAENEARAQALELMRTTLGQERYGSAYAKGLALTLDEALAAELSNTDSAQLSLPTVAFPTEGSV